MPNAIFPVPRVVFVSTLTVGTPYRHGPPASTQSFK